MTAVIKGVEYEDIKDYETLLLALACEERENITEIAILLHMMAITGDMLEYNIV